MKNIVTLNDLLKDAGLAEDGSQQSSATPFETVAADQHSETILDNRTGKLWRINMDTNNSVEEVNYV